MVRPTPNDLNAVSSSQNPFALPAPAVGNGPAFEPLTLAFRSILEAAPVAIFVCDLDSVIQYYNPAAVSLWGREPLRGVEKHCGSVRLFLPDGRGLPHDQTPLGSVMRTGIAVSGVEVEIERPDGTRLPVLVSFAPLRDDYGAIVGAVTSFHDIRQRKDTEQRLRESDARYHTLFNSIDEGFCVVEVKFDAKGVAQDYRFEEANPAFAAQCGLSDAVGRWMKELAPEHEQHWFDIYGAVARTGESTRFEAQAEALQRWFDVYAFRVGPAHRNRVAILFQDITARKETELKLRSVTAALQESEGFLRGVIKSSADCIKVIGPNGKLEWMSDNGMCMMEVDNFAVLQGRDWLSFWQDDEARAQAALALEAARQGRIGRFQGPCPTARGTVKWWDVVVSPIASTEGAAQRILSVSRDITERKSAEESLRMSEERYRALVNATTHTVWRLTGDGKSLLEMRSSIAESHRGVDAPVENWLDRYIPIGEQGSMRAKWEDAVKRRTLYEHEHETISATGEIRCWNSRAVPMIDPSGQIREWIGTSTDITERKRAEETLKRTLGELEARVAARTEELAAANRRLRQEMRARQVATQARQQLLERLVNAEDDERRRISRELHDEVGQQLTALGLGLRTLRAHVGPSGLGAMGGIL